MLPEGWQSLFLGDVFNFKNGLNGEKSLYGAGAKFVNVMDVFRGPRLRHNEIVGEMAVSPRQLMEFAVKQGDVLFNRTSETDDEIALSTVYLDTDPAVFGGFVIRARPSGKALDQEFCVYCLQAESIRRELIRRGQGAIRSNIGQADLATVPISLPPLPEQRMIAEILSTWDAAISAQERLIANAKRQKKALMQTLLPSGAHPPKKRLPGFSGEWCEIKLRELGRCYNGVTYAPADVVDGKNGLLILRSSNVQNGRLDFADTVFVKPGVKTSCLTREGDILICVRNGSRNLIGKTARITSDATGHAHGAFMSLFRSTEPDFAYHLFKSHTYDQQVKRNLGATINSINTSDLHNFRFMVPPKPERARIAEILSANDREIEHHEKLLLGTCAQKSALMQQLLTGKRRVKIDAVANA
jgi:type I restriction enzyme S subunit